LLGDHGRGLPRGGRKKSKNMLPPPLSRGYAAKKITRVGCLRRGGGTERINPNGEGGSNRAHLHSGGEEGTPSRSAMHH